MKSSKRILIKLTGELFPNNSSDGTALVDVVAQLKTITANHQIGIVVGGGNFFRGSQQSKKLGLTQSVAHQIGMVGTMMNGLLLQDLLRQQNVASTIFCALTCPSVGQALCPQEINAALDAGHVLIFTGGTGSPYVTTDTNAVMRTLQINATELWKASTVDGLYDTDPRKNPKAMLIPTATYDEVLTKNLAVMDATAFTLAREHNVTIRIFNIMTKNALVRAVEDHHVGSIITNRQR